MSSNPGTGPHYAPRVTELLPHGSRLLDGWQGAAGQADSASSWEMPLGNAMASWPAVKPCTDAALATGEMFHVPLGCAL